MDWRSSVGNARTPEVNCLNPVKKRKRVLNGPFLNNKDWYSQNIKVRLKLAVNGIHGWMTNTEVYLNYQELKWFLWGNKTTEKAWELVTNPKNNIWRFNHRYLEEKGWLFCHLYNVILTLIGLSNLQQLAIGISALNKARGPGQHAVYIF